jgi:protein disulfide-isomerase-like protein
LELSFSNFDRNVYYGRASFIKFFAPWCGHCKRVKPVWEELAELYKDSPEILIGEVDCTKEKNLCARFRVSGYPTFLYFNGKEKNDPLYMSETYSDNRDFKSFKSYVEQVINEKCKVDNLKGCSDKEKEYISKVRSKQLGTDAAEELVRLENILKGEKVLSPKNAYWVYTRWRILKQLLSGRDKVNQEL